MDEIKNSYLNNINTKKNQNSKYVKLNPVIIKKRKIRDNENAKSENEISIDKILSEIKKKNKNSHKITKDFNQYTENLEKSMNGYQMSYPQEEDEYDSDYLHLNKYINKVDKELFRKIHNYNNNYGNKNKDISSKVSHIKIGVNQMEYPNPIKSLGIIRNNHYIYSELNKNNLTRQSESFNKQIEEINHINLIYGKKMPKVHITDILLKEPSNIPLINIAKKKKSVNILSYLEKAKKDLKFFSYYKYPVKNFPEGREQFSICRQDNDIIITGGISTKMKTLAIWRLNLTTLEWKKVKTDNPIENRYGHTALSMNNKLYIFGGKTKYLNTSYMNNLDIFSFVERKIINCQMDGEKPENRKSHIAIFVGTQMLIHGGINVDGKILDDSYLFNMHTLTWNKCIINKICEHPKLWGHACCLVIPGQILYNPKFSIYSFPEFDTVKKKEYKKERIICFRRKIK